MTDVAAVQMGGSVLMMLAAAFRTVGTTPEIVQTIGRIARRAQVCACPSRRLRGHHAREAVDAPLYASQSLTAAFENVDLNSADAVGKYLSVSPIRAYVEPIDERQGSVQERVHLIQAVVTACVWP